MSDMTKIRVGFGRVDVTPEDGTPLGGYGNGARRLSNNVRDPLTASCVAITDEKDNTLLLFCTDTVRMDESWVPPLREMVQTELGIPGEYAKFSVTHTHASPDLGITIGTNHPYFQQYRDGLLAAGKQALADRAEAGIYIGRGDAPNLNFVRHYVQANGEYYGPNFGSFKASPIVGHASEPDVEFQVVKFAREGKKDILMMNWQAHPCVTSGLEKRDVSSDYVGALRDYMEQKTDMHFIYFQGACGNLVTCSRIESEAVDETPEVYGPNLAECVLPALQKMKQINGGEIKLTSERSVHPINHSEDHLLPQAEEIFKIWEETGDRTRCNQMAVACGMRSVYHARGILRKAKMGENASLPIEAASVGDLAFAFAPYEMFCDNGKEIKEGAPYEMTFIMGYTNGMYSYLPTRKAFEYSCYEANTTKFAPGIGEALAEGFVELLSKLKEQ